MRHNALTAFLAAVCLLAAFACASAGSDQLPRDPNNVYGELDNGLKYVVRKNHVPPGKVAFNLQVKSGAMNETEHQSGLAHFLEHMAFKGSAHYKPGELIPLLNQLGMSYGADTNAHTNLHETVFKLTMPDARPQTIDTALTIFADYAGALLLADVEIDSERGVIVEELRSRQSPAQRLRKRTTKELFAGTRLAVHDVLGEEELIKAFKRSDFNDYWDTWYRPENITLIAVGDVEPDELIAQARQKLGSLAARSPKREPMKAGLKPFTEPRALLMTDPEQVAGELELVSLQPARLPVTTRAQYQLEVTEDVAHWIVNRRFSDIIRTGSAPFRGARVGSEDQLREALMVYATSTGESNDWNKILDATIAEISRAIEHGFTDAELDLAKRGIIAGAERAVQIETTRDSRAIVAGLAKAIGLDQPMLSAQQRLDLMKELLADISTDELHKAFTSSFRTKSYTYVLTMPESKGVKLPTREDVLAAASAAWAKETQPPESSKMVESILAREPDAGGVAAQETDQDLGITTATFANGVLMHHKFTDYKKDQVAVSILLPGGTIEETAENRGISDAASLLVSRAATSRFTSSQIRDLMIDKKVSVGGGIAFDALTISVSGSPKDLPLGMQLAHAILTDPVLEQSALDDWKKSELQALTRRRKSAQAKVAEALGETFYGGDIRCAPLTESQIKMHERTDAEAWFKRIAGHAAIEVAVVGDIQLSDAMKLVARYVGSLPKRTGALSDLDKLRKLDRGSGPFAKTIPFEAVTPKAMVLAGFVSCDALDPQRRPLALASLILTDRMIERIRQKDQLVYSIRCQNAPAVSIPGTGMLSAAAPTDPHNADKLAETILAMIKDFAQTGPKDDELVTAKKQMANQLASQLKEPAFWVSQLGDLAYRGRPLADLKDLPQVYQTFTPEQLRDAIRQCATDDRTIRIAATPHTTSAAPHPATMPAKSP